METHHSVPVPTLENLALFKVLVPLWNHYDQKLTKIKSKICDGEINREEYATWSRKELRAVRRKIRRTIQKLELPKSLQDRLVYFMDLIGMQINSFKNFFHWNCQEPPKTCLEFVWTVHGTVDKTETAKKIVRDESRDLKLRYKLSCFFCFEEEILKLWNRIENEAKEEFLTSKFELIRFWSCLAEGKVNKGYHYKPERNRDPYEYAFKVSLKTNNEAGTKYFFNLLNPEKRDSILLDAIAVFGEQSNKWCHLYFPPEYYGDVFFFLYSKMKEQHRIEALNVAPDDIATIFWFWPYKIYCVEFLNMLHRHSSTREFNLVLNGALYYCRSAFEDFWLSSSFSVKKGFVSEFCKENYGDLEVIIDCLAEYQNVTVFKDIITVVNEEWLSKIYTFVVNLKKFHKSKEKSAAAKVLEEYYLLVKEKMKDCDPKKCYCEKRIDQTY